MDQHYGKPKSSSRRPLVFGILTLLLFGYAGYQSFWKSSGTAVTSAVAILAGPQVTGTIVFNQHGRSGLVDITGKLKGLSPGTKHGFHVHEYGDLREGCLSAGAHFNPFRYTHGSPKDNHRHTGDLGNIEADEFGNADFTIKDAVISLNYDSNNIIGRAVVVHAAIDDLGRGNDEESLKTGNAGARIACGVIALSRFSDAQ